jgi:hypothetical protein
MLGDHGFSFVLDEELSEDNLVAFIVTTPSGKTVHIWFELELDGRTAILRQFAIGGLDGTPVALGFRVLRNMARAAMEEYDVDCIQIKEARRTTGACPGRIASQILFRRQTG